MCKQQQIINYLKHVCHSNFSTKQENSGKTTTEKWNCRNNYQRVKVIEKQPAVSSLCMLLRFDRTDEASQVHLMPGKKKKSFLRWDKWPASWVLLSCGGISSFCPLFTFKIIQYTAGQYAISFYCIINYKYLAIAANNMTKLIKCPVSVTDLGNSENPTKSGLNPQSGHSNYNNNW